MKILLVYPEFPETFWSFRHAMKFEGKKSAFPPLGLLTVSAMLPKEWERRLVDMNVCVLQPADIEWADMVFISAMLAQRDSLRQVLQICKAQNKRIVVGGPYISTSSSECPEADHIFVGEAEMTIPEFVRDLAAGTARRMYEAAERPSLALTPPPDYRLIDLKAYSAMSVQYSRGCPFQCEFCDIIEIYGRKPRSKTNEQMLAELDALYQAGWRGPVFVADDNFIGNKPNVKRLLPALAEWSEQHHYPFAFSTEASVNLSEDEELMTGMRQAGFRRVFLGIETPVEQSLQETQKYQNTRHDLLSSVRRIQSYGMEVMAGFIVGFDNDPEDIFERQIEFIRESAIPLATVGLLTALPDTQLWRRLKREGRLLAESTGNNTDASLNFVPRMDRERLIEGYKTILRSIYNPSEYYQRSLDCMDAVPQAVNEPRGQNLWDDLLILARIVFTLGIRDRWRREFWRYCRAVRAKHRHQFPQAIRLAALGYHLRKLTEVIAARARPSDQITVTGME